MKNMMRALLGAFLLLAVPAYADDISNGSYSTTDGGNNASPPNGWPAGMFPNQVEPSARSNMGATKRFWERANPALSTTGSAGAYVITPSNTAYPTAYTQGEILCGKANFTAVGNDTLNYNSLGAKALYVQGVSVGRVTAGSIVTGAQFCVSYDGALNSGAGGFQLLTTTFPAGLGTAAFQPTSAFDPAGAAAAVGVTANTALTNAATAQSAANAAQSTANGALVKSSNLGDLTSAGTARNNLGLGSMATRNVTVSTGGPSGTPNDGDIWIQY